MVTREYSLLDETFQKQHYHRSLHLSTMLHNPSIDFRAMNRRFKIAELISYKKCLSHIVRHILGQARHPQSQTVVDM